MKTSKGIRALIPRQLSLPCSGVCILLSLVWTAILILTQSQGINIIPVVMKPTSLDVLKFIEYIPSVLEEEWFDNRNAFESDPSKICEGLEEHAGALSVWASTTGRKSGPRTIFLPDNTTKDDVFSKLVYITEQNSKKHVRVMEPLVGHLRHPYALPHCKPEKAIAVNVQDRSYIAFAGMSSWEPNLYPGKKYLFDLGTADYETSLAYIIAQYENLGIYFDRIWAWEVTAKPKYWDTVTDIVQGKLHFYNKPVSSDVKSPAHPLQILKSIYQAGDFVVRLYYFLNSHC